MDRRSILLRQSKAGFEKRLELYGPVDASGKPVNCKIGSSIASAVAVRAYSSSFRDESEADEGGFVGLHPHTARYLREGNPEPRQGMVFFDGRHWFNVGAITSQAANPEWVFELKPMSST